MTESPETFSVNRLERVIEHVRDMVAMFRRRGEKTEYALPKIAGLLDTKPHRVKSLFYRDKMWALPEFEADRIEARFDAYLDREIALSIEYTEMLRVKKRQLNLVFECNEKSPRGCGYVSTGSQLRATG